MIKWTGFIVFLGFFLLGLLFSRCGSDGNVIDTVACPIAPAVSKLQVAEKYYNRKVQTKTNMFYRANDYRRVWLGKRKPEKMFGAFLDEVKESVRYGFHPDEYHLEEVQKSVSQLYDDPERTNADISNLDIKITASFFLFTTHLLEGRIRYPGARNFFWERGMPLENDIALLLKMESASDLRKEMETLHPDDKQYENLQQVLLQYRDAAKADTLPPLPSSISVKPGDTHDAIPLLRKKLALVDSEHDAADLSNVYDDGLAESVKQFQLRHGLEPDGLPGPQTISALNTPLKEKAELIALNLERLRWRPHIKLQGDAIVINVPEYMLRVYDDEQEKMKMRVVLGSDYTPTPVFQDTLKYIVFSPTWIVPRSIFEEEFYPKLREDAEHFEAGRYQFFKDGQEIDPADEDWDDKDFDISKYSVIENPGDVNSLGKVKFIMPNNYSVYLHDTPADRLFQRDERALSHGCIRLERPAELAAYLLADHDEWNEERIREAMEANEPKRVDLDKTVSVYIVYRTVWIDEEDRVHFRDDIYGHDKRHLASLD